MGNLPIAYLSQQDEAFAALGTFFDACGYGDFVPENFATQFAHASFGALTIGDGAICGAVLFRLIGEECEIIEIAVAEGSRGAGMAGAMLADLTSYLAGAGTRRLILEVAEDNHAALGLYHKYGFRQIAKRARYYKQKIDAIILELALSKV